MGKISNYDYLNKLYILRYNLNKFAVMYAFEWLSKDIINLLSKVDQEIILYKSIYDRYKKEKESLKMSQISMEDIL